ncbi:MAG: UDP-N-acetylmuramate dehydrogenase [Proteobacteria bacterium]|nr:UDP-N-acetylmuramate dehydrogenase [Pseudomonadota bacterium]
MSQPCFQSGIRLADHTTFRLGGAARAFCEARTAREVVEGVWKAESMGMGWYVIGHGSNILASDDGYNGTVISFKDSTSPALNRDGTVTVSGGYSLRELIEFCACKGLAGLENFSGIPGTVGGAIAGNAGAYGSSMGEMVGSILLLDRNGNMRKAEGPSLSFTYRSSSIRERGEVVLDATIALRRGDAAEIRALMQKRLSDRRAKHPDPATVATAGSFFKNPTLGDGTRVAAGRLLEQAGCKDLRVGGARPWHTHANIIVTEGPSSASEVMELAKIMSEKVGRVHGIELATEVVYLE